MKVLLAPLFFSFLVGMIIIDPAAAQFDDESSIVAYRSGNSNGNGNGNSNGNSNGNGGNPNTQASRDCVEMFNPGICKKMESIAEGVSAADLDIEDVKSLKKLLKEAQPVNPKKKNFKE